MCDTADGTCVQCLVSAQCTGGQVCDPTTNTYVTAPTTVISSSPANPTNATVAVIAFNSPGNPGGSAPTACTSPFTSGVLSAASHTFTVRAALGLIKDPVGATVTWSIDTTAPSAPTVSTPANGTRTDDSTPTVTGVAEAGAVVSVFIDGVKLVATALANGSGAWSLTVSSALTDGTHVVSAFATDAAGNQSPMSAFNLFIIDTTAPLAPTIASPAPNGVVGTTTPTISGTAEAGSTVRVTLDGLLSGTATADAGGRWSFTPGTALAVGAHQVSAAAVDAVGNVGPSSSLTDFTVDLTVLDTTIVSGPPALGNSTTASFVFTANKPGATF